MNYRPVLIGIRSTDPMIDHLPATVESMRSTILKLGLLSEAEFPVLLAQCRNHLRDPGTVLRSFMVAQVWGRKPVRSSVVRQPTHAILSIAALRTLQLCLILPLRNALGIFDFLGCCVSRRRVFVPSAACF